MSQSDQQPGDITRSVKFRVDIVGSGSLSDMLRAAFEESGQAVERINRRRELRHGTDCRFERSDRSMALERQGPAEAFAGLVELRGDTVIDFS